jgi:hypothetical protein
MKGSLLEYKLVLRECYYLYNPAFIKLWSAAVSRLFWKKIIAKVVLDTEGNEKYTHTLKLPLLVDLQQKLGELTRSITSYLSIIILENTFK